MGAVPSLHACKQEGDCTYQRTHHHHGVKAYEAPTEEASQGERLAPAVIIGIANDKTREDEKEIHGKVAMVDKVNYGLVACKLEALKHMIPHDEQSCHAAKSIEQSVMGFGIGKCHL